MSAYDRERLRGEIDFLAQQMATGRMRGASFVGRNGEALTNAAEVYLSWMKAAYAAQTATDRVRTA